MSFVLDLLQSRQRGSKGLSLDIWPVALQPSDRDNKQGFEPCTNVSVSSSCSGDVVRGDSHTASSCSGDGNGSQPQTQSSNIDLGISELAKRPSAAQRKLQSNRQAQKRFRDRQKVCLLRNLCLHVGLTAVVGSGSTCLCRKGRIPRKQSC